MATGIAGAAVRKQDLEFVKIINQELAALKKEGFILKVLQKYATQKL